MNIIKTDIEGVLILEPRLFRDSRGYFFESFSEREFEMLAQSSNNNKRIAKNTLLLYFRMLFMIVVSLYTSRVIQNVLGVEDFGIL